MSSGAIYGTTHQKSTMGDGLHLTQRGLRSSATYPCTCPATVLIDVRNRFIDLPTDFFREKLGNQVLIVGF